MEVRQVQEHNFLFLPSPSSSSFISLSLFPDFLSFSQVSSLNYFLTNYFKDEYHCLWTEKGKDERIRGREDGERLT